jgi:hypothetical protein
LPFAEGKAEPARRAQIEHAGPSPGIEQEVQWLVVASDGDLYPDDPVAKLEGNGSGRGEAAGAKQQNKEKQRKEAANAHAPHLAKTVRCGPLPAILLWKILRKDRSRLRRLD